MGYAITIPKNEEEAQFVISKLVRDGKQRRNPQAVGWWINHWFLRGARNFTQLNYNEGSVTVGYTDTDGILQFQYEGVTAQYIGQLGRLLAIDLAPVARRKGISLDGLRKSGIGQTVLSAAFPDRKIENFKMDLFSALLMYGTAGVVLWVENEDSMGMEVVMPWELLPIPVTLSSPQGARGIIRRRMVPQKWVKDLSAMMGKRKSRAFQEMLTYEVPVGDMPAEVYNRFQGENSGLSFWGDGTVLHDKTMQKNYIGAGGARKEDKTRMKITELAEVWMFTPDGYLDEYLVQAGDKLLFRSKMTTPKHPPIAVARDTTVGGFWGRSYVGTLIPLNTEIEFALQSTFQALQDFDTYGVTMWPASAGTPAEADRGSDGIRKLLYEVDYTVPEQKPFNVQPAKMTPFHMKSVELAVQLNDKIANQPQALMQGDAPGRVDSSQGLGLLYEFSSVPLAPIAKSVAEAVSTIYRAALGVARDTWASDKVVEINSLDDGVAGVTLDTEAGTMSLKDNAIPHPDEVVVTVSSAVPQSDEQKKTDLKEALDRQVITLREYQFKVREEGLDLPVGDESAWQNYRRAKMENILLFGDGHKSGEIIPSERDMHQVHLDVLDAFMAKPEFHLADQAVRDKFVEHYDYHMTGLGTLPEGMPSPDEAAEMAMMMGDQSQMGPEQLQMGQEVG
jgi:hypothetical protein